MAGFYVNHFVSKKGNECYGLYLDLGYTKKYLSFKTADIAEMLDMSPSEFAQSVPLDTDVKLDYVAGRLVLPHNKNE